MPTTLRDVAQEAGVSVSTVSRVIRNERYVSEATRQKVLEAIESVQYRPDPVARRLKYGRTYAIGFVVPDISNPFFSHAVRGAEQAIHNSEHPEYELVLCNTDGEAERERNSIELLLSKRVEGIILASTATEGSVTLVRQVVEENHVPVVAIDNEVYGLKMDLITVNNCLGAYELTSHLIQHGHRRIGIIAGSLHESSASERLEGYKQALIEHNLELDEELVAIGDWKQESGYLLTNRWLDLANRPTAIFGSNNFMSMGALLALRERGLRVPEDMAIVSFDDVEFGYLLRPALTTLDYSWRKIGETAARLMLDRIGRKYADCPPRCILLPFKFLVRESCGCHRALNGVKLAGTAASLP
jgi:LacI family transcriptional regulator